MAQTEGTTLLGETGLSAPTAPGVVQLPLQSAGPAHRSPAPPQFHALHHALAVPAPDPAFWLDAPVKRVLEALAERTARGAVVNVLLVGPSGTGKSSLPREFAAWKQRPFFAVHCQLATEPGDWWGTREVSPAQGTYFVEAALVHAVETPGCVVLLDEANRTAPENLNALFGLLDHRRAAWIPALQREVNVAPGVVFMVTLNEGADYVGTYAVDRALRDRVANTLRLNYLPKDVETEVLVTRTGVDRNMARRIVEFVGVVRANPKLRLPVSTRQLLECAAMVNEGLSLEDAALFTMVNAAREEVDRKALLQALQLTSELREAYAAQPLLADD